MHSKASLRELSTTQLRQLLSNYQSQRQTLPRQHRSARTNNFTTDTMRIKEAINDINAELRLRTRNKNPLKTFAN